MQAQNQHLNFAPFGQIVSGVDNLNYNHTIPASQRDESTQLPYYFPLSYYSMSRIIIPEQINIHDIQSKIITAIQDIEGVQYSWNAERAVWTIHYGTTPKIWQITDYIERMWFQRYLTCAHNCALEAQRKFPHLLDFDDDELYNWEMPAVEFGGGSSSYWGKYKLYLSMDRQYRKIILSFDRISNDSGHHAYHAILTRLWNAFGLESNWENRMSFLSLEEGTKSVTANAKDEDKNKLQYLFDYGIMREVCGFLSGYTKRPNYHR
jgi:hypothetical protein